MIEQIKLTNFQSHPDTVVDFHPGVNVIVGESDKGKSALLRSLFWVWTNRPSGESVWSDWSRGEKGEKCEVEIKTAEGTVTRTRSNTVNAYAVDGEILKAVGVDVPAEAQALLNLSEVNVQRQMDPPFLLSSTAGEVSRFFNGVLKMEDVDKCLAAIGSKRAKTRDALKAGTTRAEYLEGQIEELAWVESAQATLAEVEATASSVASEGARIGDLEQLVADYDREMKVAKTAPKVAVWAKELKRLEKLGERIGTDAGQITRLSRALEGLTEAQETRSHLAWVEGARGQLEELEGLKGALETVKAKGQALRALVDQWREASEAIKEAERLLAVRGLVEEIGRAKERAERMGADADELEELTTSLARAERASVEARADIERLKARLPELCPLCGGRMHG